MGKTSSITLRRLERFWKMAKLYVNEAVSGRPEEEKEIITVLTADSSAPATAEEGDYYINTSSNKLYQYDGSEWGLDTASASVLYITADTSILYLYNGTAFVAITGPVDNVIYISDYDDLDTYTTKGLYTVCYTQPKMTGLYWTMTVVLRSKRVGHTYIDRYTQTLYNYNGYRTRTKEGSGSWSEWEEFVYVSEAELEDIRKVAKKALKTAKAAL